MGLSVNEIMRNTLSTKWTMTDDFEFSIHSKSRTLDVGGSLTGDDVLSMSVMNLDLPQLGSDVESVMQAGVWRIYNVKFQPFTFSVTFRDFGSMDLRNYFAGVWMDAQRGYFEDVKSHVKVSTQGNIVFESEDCLITGVSQVQLDNSNTQITEFTVEFSTPYFSNWQIKNFGSDEFRESKAGQITGPLGQINDLVPGDVDILESLRNVVSKTGSWF